MKCIQSDSFPTAILCRTIVLFNVLPFPLMVGILSAFEFSCILIGQSNAPLYSLHILHPLISPINLYDRLDYSSYLLIG